MLMFVGPLCLLLTLVLLFVKNAGVCRLLYALAHLLSCRPTLTDKRVKSRGCADDGDVPRRLPLAADSSVPKTCSKTGILFHRDLAQHRLFSQPLSSKFCSSRTMIFPQVHHLEVSKHESLQIGSQTNPNPTCFAHSSTSHTGS